MACSEDLPSCQGSKRRDHIEDFSPLLAVSMYLRRYHRRKNGKNHVYWALVESIRTAGGPRQRVVSYLGELSPNEREGWARLGSVLDGKAETKARQLGGLPASAPVRELREPKIQTPPPLAGPASIVEYALEGVEMLGGGKALCLCCLVDLEAHQDA